MANQAEDVPEGDKLWVFAGGDKEARTSSPFSLCVQLCLCAGMEKAVRA